MRLRIVTPITTKDFSNFADLAPYVRADTSLSEVGIDHGPASIESDYDEMLATPATVARIIEAEREGIDGVVINCMGDPGLQAGREAVGIPVVGPCEAAMHAAAMLGHQFGVITVMKSLRPSFENRAKVYGVRDKLVSVRGVEIAVLDLEKNRDHMIAAMTDEAERAVRDDGAHVLIFGCTGMAGAAEAIEAGLLARGVGHVPVIDSMLWAVKQCEAMVDMKLRHSKLTWPTPPGKRIDGYAFVPSFEGVSADSRGCQ